MSKYDLSVIIAARCEEFLPNTIDDILRNRRGKTECIVISDGSWPVIPLADHPDVTLIHVPESIGQRAAVNLGARLSNSSWIMKSDAHVSFAPGFDVTLMRNCQPNWLVVPRQWNLHAFDFRCRKCGSRWYQGAAPDRCYLPEGSDGRVPNPKCNSREFEKVLVWLPRNGEYWSCSECHEYFHSKQQPSECPKCGSAKGFKNDGRKMLDSMRFDSDLHYQQFHAFHLWDGIAAFINAKSEAWIYRLLVADIETPDQRLLDRAREYVESYDLLPPLKKIELRTKAMRIWEVLQYHAGRTQKAKLEHLFNLIRAAQGDMVETMSLLGACWFVRRDFFFDVLDGLDEATGSWGQMGTELACKVFTSGNRLVCHRGTFYSHLFRTSPGFAFPYGQSGVAQEAAKQYSRNLWRNNAWPGQVHPLSWLVERFSPCPSWDRAAIDQLKAAEVNWKPKKTVSP